MSRFHSYLHAACTLVASATAGKPLAFSLKAYFSAHPQMGSRDRKTVATLCYNYYRCFFAFQNQILPESIIKSQFICSSTVSDFLAFHAPHLNPCVAFPIDEKCAMLGIKITDFFPFASQVGHPVELFPFIKSLLVQPDSFLRIRKGRKPEVTNALKEAGINFSEISEGVIRFPAGQPVDKAIALDRDAVIQDFSSQQVFFWLQQHPEKVEGKELHVWDCCSASGGKSILLYDLLRQKPKITVSDIRKQSIHNLKERLGRAGIPLHRALVADLTSGEAILPDENFDIILADVPCSGSGTWARTPEQMAGFKKDMLIDYSASQRAISKAVTRNLSPHGLLFYITCSVFKEENESVVDWLCQNGLKLLDMSYICGYNGKADTMFSAVLTKE